MERCRRKRNIWSLLGDLKEKNAQFMEVLSLVRITALLSFSPLNARMGLIQRIQPKKGNSLECRGLWKRRSL